MELPWDLKVYQYYSYTKLSPRQQLCELKTSDGPYFMELDYCHLHGVNVIIKGFFFGKTCSQDSFLVLKLATTCDSPSVCSVGLQKKKKSFPTALTVTHPVQHYSSIFHWQICRVCNNAPAVWALPLLG